MLCNELIAISYFLILGHVQFEVVPQRLLHLRLPLPIIQIMTQEEENQSAVSSVTGRIVILGKDGKPYVLNSCLKTGKVLT